ncbi:ABC transporter ATP-binding protein [Aneurinibacillus aneurinilyticus]|uniref:ABC transporter ATP-binding protein n=1 Tax=Aneurinibacillus aneurinilyticus TaxID=1391 RepID=UPI002E1B7FD7|nr:ABC transporter ATP-binding protein [Aneurinibacillus aneurinilyticus]
MYNLKKIFRSLTKENFSANIKEPLIKILPYIKPHWKIYTVLVILLFADLGMTIGMATFLKLVTDATVNKNIQQLEHLFLVGIILILFVCSVIYMNSYLSSIAISKVTRDLRVKLFEKILGLPTPKFLKYHSGDLLSRLTSDINNVAGLVGNNLLQMFKLPITAVAVFIYLLKVNWQLSVVCLLIGPAFLLIGGFFGFLLKKISRDIYDELAKVNSFLNDILSGHEIVRSFILEQVFLKKFIGQSNNVLSLQLKQAKLSSIMRAGSSSAGAIAYLLNLGLGAFLVAKGALSIGSLLAFVSLMHYLIYPFTGMVSTWISFQQSVSAWDRILQILDSPGETRNLPEYIPHKEGVHSIHFRNLCFSYDGEKNVIENFNLSIPAGKIIALVGPSGAGKSTLFKLFLGLYQPTSGSIHLDSQSIKTLSPSALRSSIAYVPQESYLFSGTIRENLLYGRANTTEEELIKAAKIANAHEFIMSLPDKYDTEIGERGVKLSGGQKQRISIARAVLKNSSILLLDEATSALDNESEYIIQESLDRLMESRTTLVIAHRLSTIKNADCIIVMDKGQIVAQGRHNYLLKHNDLYARLFHLQFQDKLLPHNIETSHHLN